MEAIMKILVTAIVDGGSGAIVALLLAGIALLIWDRRRLLRDLERKDSKIESIVEDYYKGTITLGEALNSLKMVLIEIKGKL